MNSKEDEKLNNEKLSEQAVKTYLKDLPSEITPERDLWKGIEHAIDIKPNQHLIIDLEEESPRLLACHGQHQ